MKKIFCVGDVNPDIFMFTENKPSLGIEKKADYSYMSLGGNAGNTAVALTSLGFNPILVSAVGKDKFAEFVKNELKKFKVKSSLIESNIESGVSVIFVAENSERAIISTKGCLEELNCMNVWEKIKKIKKDDLVYFGGYYHLKNLRKEFPSLLEKIRKKKAKILFDTTYDEYHKWELLGFVKYIDVLFMNEIEINKITRMKSTNAGLKNLFERGAKEVVLKKGEKGAVSFSKNKKTEFPALKIRAINSTGAGDFFNAGYIYGMLNDFGEKSKLACGNFIAGAKIESKEYFTPKQKSLENYLKEENLINVEITGNYDLLSQKIAKKIIAQIKQKPNSIFTLASGNTPLGVYKELMVAKNKGMVNFSKARFLQMDEYLEVHESKTFRKYIEKNILKLGFLKNNILLFDTEKNMKAECKKFSSFINKNGIDFALLGIGANGHIAFNEPGTSFDSKTRVVLLNKETIKTNNLTAGQKAVTLGLSDIMKSKKIILAANSSGKANALKKTVKLKYSTSVPASILQKHRNATIVADKKAGKFIQ